MLWRQQGLCGLKPGNDEREAEHRGGDWPKGPPRDAEQTEHRQERVPLKRARQHRPMGRTGLVNALKEPRPEDAAIDDRAADAQALERSPIQYASPFAVAAPVELFRVLEIQQGLRLSIAGLLSQIGARVLATMVPHEGARRKRDPVAGLFQP